MIYCINFRKISASILMTLNVPLIFRYIWVIFNNGTVSSCLNKQCLSCFRIGLITFFVNYINRIKVRPGIMWCNLWKADLSSISEVDKFSTSLDVSIEDFELSDFLWFTRVWSFPLGNLYRLSLLVKSWEASNPIEKNVLWSRKNRFWKKMKIIISYLH